MRNNVCLISRVLVVLGLALIIASTVANHYGAKTESHYEGVLDIDGAQGVAVYVMSMASAGVATIKLEGVTSAYYIANVSGDVASLVQSLSIFNISALSETTQHDVRAGLVYGYASLKTSKFLLGTLPLISKMLNFGIYTVDVSNYTASVTVMLEPSQSIVVIGVPNASIIYYNIDYKLLNYQRLSYKSSLIFGSLLIIISICIEYLRSKWRKTET